MRSGKEGKICEYTPLMTRIEGSSSSLMDCASLDFYANQGPTHSKGLDIDTLMKESCHDRGSSP